MLRDRHGAPVLIDLDGFAVGPREWDLILTAIYYDSFGWHTRQEYEDFARVYGYDIMQWPGYPVLREIREFLMVTWLIQKAAEDARAGSRRPGASTPCEPARAARTGTGLSTLRDDLADVHARAGYATHRITIGTRTLNSMLTEVGWSGKDIHLMSVDTEGSEPQVLRGIDLTVWRPWVLVVEATEPLSTEPTRGEWESVVLGAGYRFCLFDGLSCFYVAEEKADDLGPALSYPACALDFFTTPEERALQSQIDETRARLDELRGQLDIMTTEAAHWRSAATSRWSIAVGLRNEREVLSEQSRILEAEAASLRRQIADLRASTSWTLTKPVRFAGAALRRAQDGR